MTTPARNDAAPTGIGAGVNERDTANNSTQQSVTARADEHSKGASAPLAVPEGVPDWAWGKLARPEGHRWAIVERNACGEVIGTGYRQGDGSKDFKKAASEG